VKFRLLTLLALALMSFYANAADIARAVVTSSDRSDAYAELKLSVITANIPAIGLNEHDSVEDSDDVETSLGIELDARFRYKNLFLDFVADSFSNIAIGYSVHDSNTSSHEVLITNVFNDIRRNNVLGFETITEREGDANLGFRSNFYRGANVFQLELMRDVSHSHEGVIGSLQFGRQKQIRNWNLHGLIGARYFSDKVVDYYFGVSPDEAVAAIPQYTGKASVMPSIEIGATLPLSEKWLFKTRAEYYQFPDSLSDSPLVQGDKAYQAEIGVSYVFGTN